MIIVTHRKEYFHEGCSVVNSLEAAIDVAEVNHESELFIIGGGEIFALAIDLANKIYMTNVHADVNADVFFPKIDLSDWEIIEFDNSLPNDEDDLGSDFRILQREKA